MLTKTIQLFTEKEEEFVNLLIEIGTKKTIAKALVFLANTKEATSREIERGTDLRQPEVSLALKYMMNRGWMKSHENPSNNKGRPFKVYGLAISMQKIMDSIETEKNQEVKNQLTLVKKMRSYV